MTDITFQSMNLSQTIMTSLDRLNFHTPTLIQAQAIPVALQGVDLIATAETGSGKTAAFGIPLLEHLLKNPQSMALVLTPTRELAVQVLKVLEQLLPRHKVDVALLIGGESYFKQMNMLKRNPRLIVGTPGRINDHLDRGSVSFDRCDFLVLDETDRMLDMGFGVQLEKIIPHLREKRQTIMFSATMESSIQRVAQKYLTDPQMIKVGCTRTPAKTIKQENVTVNDREKYTHLLSHLENTQGSSIIFSNTKSNSHFLAEKLKKAGYTAEAIHGDLRQRDRDRVIRLFHGNKIRILVATDIAARGLDIPHIEYVVNYDLPQCPQDYIHRIGRTGRAGSEGTAINFIGENDQKKWKAICQLLNPKVKEPTAVNNRPRPQKAFGKSSEKPFGKPFSKPFGKSSERSFSKSSDRPFNRSSDQGKSFDKPFNRSSEQGKSFDKPFDKPFGKSFSKKPKDSSGFKDHEKSGFSKNKKKRFAS